MKVGDKVRIIGNKNHYFKIGDIGTITSISLNENSFDIKINKIYQTVQKHEVELVSEKSSYYFFFRFLHPNMEETTCIELFDTLIKEYESNSKIE